jgi:hypothetical protein
VTDRPVPRACPACESNLASDNAGPLCSPCWQVDLARHARGALRSGGEPEAIAAAFAHGGVPGVASTLSCPLGEALDLVLLQGLVPPAYRRRYRVLLALLELGPVPHVVAGERLGLSRWTVATYRQALGARLRPATGAAVASSRADVPTARVPGPVARDSGADA